MDSASGSKRGSADELDEVQKSLQIKNDERYARMDHYKNHGGTNAGEGSHFSKLIKTDRISQGDTEAVVAIDEETDFKDVANTEGEMDERHGPARLQSTNGVGDRVQWQETFDRNIRKLMLDFQLTDVPSIRLNHLDRMSDWFVGHGQKQARKAAKGPNYLTADRSATPQPGSTRGIPVKMSNATLRLAGSYTARGYGPPSATSTPR